MKDLAMLKFIIAIGLGLGLALGACQSGEFQSPITDVKSDIDGLPPITQYLYCLPEETAIMAAHRGTAKQSKYPENSMSALNTLIKKGYLVTEVDVAGLRDGTHILFHDGVWDEKSTGQGSVAASTWRTAEKILLEDTRGKISADRPVVLKNYLSTAKGKIYVEIDFKSSSKYETVIKTIRALDMEDQVVLISYSAGQAKKLSRLAPDMLISTKPNDALARKHSSNNAFAAWLGYDLSDKNLVQRLRTEGIPILGRIKKDWSKTAVKSADILITDYIFNHEPIIGLTKSTRAEMNNCLAQF